MRFRSVFTASAVSAQVLFATRGAVAEHGRAEEPFFGFINELSRSTSGHSGQILTEIAPKLLESRPPEHDQESLWNYRNSYVRLMRSMNSSLYGDLLMTPLEESPGHPVHIILSHLSGPIVYAAGWNGTANVPPDPNGIRRGGALVWVDATSEDMATACKHTIELKGPLVVIVSWMPDNFAHFMLDMLPLLFWIRRFRAPPQARFGILDAPLH